MKIENICSSDWLTYESVASLASNYIKAMDRFNQTGSFTDEYDMKMYLEKLREIVG